VKSEFLIAITQLAAEKNLPKEVVLQAMEAALVSAYKKDGDLTGNLTVRIDRETGDHHVYLERTVVHEVTDPKIEIGLVEARRIKADVIPGDIIQDEVHPGQASLEVAGALWSGMRDAMAASPHPVPLGVNVEEISFHNFDLAMRMAAEFSRWKAAKVTR